MSLEPAPQRQQRLYRKDRLVRTRLARYPLRGILDAHLIRTIPDSLDYMDSMDNSQP